VTPPGPAVPGVPSGGIHQKIRFWFCFEGARLQPRRKRLLRSSALCHHL